MSKAQIIEAMGEAEILSMIRGGQSQAEIARTLGVGSSTLNEWLHADPERSARTRDAMSMSAETWLDRGLDALVSAMPDAPEIARARAIEQHCARRAAIRDPKRYGDKLAIGGADDLPAIKTMDDAQLDARIAALAEKHRAAG